MHQISSEVLGFTKEAVVLARGDRIIYTNPAAAELLGRDVSERSVSAVFGAEVAGMQAGCFVGSTFIQGKSHMLRVTRQEDVQAIFFGLPEVSCSFMNDAFIYAMRGWMMTCGMAVDICRNRSEELADAELSGALAALSQSQYALNRVVANMTLAQSLLNNEMVFKPMEMDLAVYVHQYLDSLRFLRRDIEVLCGGAGSLRASVDPALLEQMLSNLLSNCLLHAKGCSRISVNIMDCGEMAMLSVSDDGCGMEPEQLHTVFERYRHVYGMTEMNAGAGVGLTVVRGVAEKHGGTLLLESRPGHGTTVRVSLRKKLREEQMLCSGEECYGGEIKALLLGLAGCLDDKFYTERYMD